MRTAPFELAFPSDRVLEGLAREVITHTCADQYLSDRHRAFGQLLSERLRLARELHDGLLQSLTGAALQLDATLRTFDADPHAAREYVKQCLAANPYKTKEACEELALEKVCMKK